jgi:hypothetical protein
VNFFWYQIMIRILNKFYNSYQTYYWVQLYAPMLSTVPTNLWLWVTLLAWRNIRTFYGVEKYLIGSWYAVQSMTAVWIIFSLKNIGKFMCFFAWISNCGIYHEENSGNFQKLFIFAFKSKLDKSLTWNQVSWRFNFFVCSIAYFSKYCEFQYILWKKDFIFKNFLMNR